MYISSLHLSLGTTTTGLVCAEGEETAFDIELYDDEFGITENASNALGAVGQVRFSC